MLSFLVIDQDFQVIKVALTVVTPWPLQDFLKVRMLSLVLSHVGGYTSGGKKAAPTKTVGCEVRRRRVGLEGKDSASERQAKLQGQ